MRFSRLATASRRPGSRPCLERLEDRLTPSWGGIPPATVTVPSSFTSVSLNSSGDASGSASITANETDWYRVTLPTGSTIFQATTPNSRLDTVIGIYNASGSRVGYNDDISSSNRDSRTTITLAAGTYYLGVTNYTGTAGGSYVWAVDGPAAAAPTDDSYEDNDTLATAYNLGTPTAPVTLTNLVMADGNDYYRFTTTGTGSGSVSVAFTHSLGDVDIRLFNSAGTQVGASEGTGNSESISLASLAAGTYTLRVFGYNGATNPNYSLTVTPPTGTPPPTGGFAITLRVTGMTASQQAVFAAAAARWAEIITGDLPNATYQGVAVDDVLIDASGIAIDGSGGILGQAGPDSFRTTSRLPIHGIMQFDTADLASLESGGGLFSVIFHEMGHVIGIGTIWSSLGLLSGAGGTNPRFTGTNATAQYNAIFGLSETSVPVENTGGSGTRDSHWRETVFGNEVMTGYLNNGTNPVSRITIGSLQDLGYQVNYDAADSYTPPGGGSLVGGGGGSGGGGGGSLIDGRNGGRVNTPARRPETPDAVTRPTPTRQQVLDVLFGAGRAGKKPGYAAT